MRAVSAVRDRVAPVGVGESAPDFSVFPGQWLSDLRGRPVVVVFHPPQWNPGAAEHVQRYNRMIVGMPGMAAAKLLGVDGAGVWHEADFADSALAFPVLSGDEVETARLYGVGRAPAVFVVDEDGVVQWRHVAQADLLLSPDAVEAALRARADGDRVDATGGVWNRRDFLATALAATFAMTLEPEEHTTG